ncbi:MAG: response regulator transcription factor [Candidatus Melainabacteria bacterium]|nr:response regulator transcription factor [Candidatus Melainabacteria bacterium]
MKQLKKEQLFLCGKTTLELRTILQTHKVETLSNKDLLELLTARETEVLHSLTQGVNYKQIAKLLFISESTVKTHVNNIFTKLNVSDRTQAVLYALRHGIESLAKKPNILRDITNEALHKNQLSV